MSNTTRERLLKQNAKLIRTQRISIPVEGEDPIVVEVRSPTMGQTSSFAAVSEEPGARLRSLVKMVIATTYDPESGNPIFTEADEDLLLKAPASGGWMSDLLTALGGLTDEAKATAKN